MSELHHSYDNGQQALGREKPQAVAGQAAKTPAAKRKKVGAYAQRVRRGTLVTVLFFLGFILFSVLYVVVLRLSNESSILRFNRYNAKPQLVVNTTPEPEDAALPVPEVIAKASPSVVSIDLYLTDSETAGSSASGVVVSEDGYIVTCAHVISKYPLIRAVLPNGDTYKADLVGVDEETDLAVLKIWVTGLVPAEFAKSEDLLVGNRVVAIGNVAGILPGTPTLGIMSGFDRTVTVATPSGDIVLEHLLQTDAAISPGNSGGALVNTYGQVIGINVAKLEMEYVENVAFAIPSEIAIPVIQRIVDDETNGVFPKLGVSVMQVERETAEKQGLPMEGLYITHVSKESSIGNAGVSIGDVIVAAGGYPVKVPKDLYTLVSLHKPGDTMELHVFLHKTGEIKKVEVEVYAASHV